MNLFKLFLGRDTDIIPNNIFNLAFKYGKIYQ